MCGCVVDNVTLTKLDIVIDIVQPVLLRPLAALLLSQLSLPRLMLLLVLSLLLLLLLPVLLLFLMLLLPVSVASCSVAAMLL